jgi:hypothetical protein
MDNIVKYQHYVPILYLKKFTADLKSIHVFDKFTGKRFVSNVDSVACEKYFYDLKEERDNNHATQQIEKNLGKLETKWQILLQTLVEDINQNNILNTVYKSDLSLLLSVLLLRTKECRESTKEFLGKTGSQMSQVIAHDLFPQYSEEVINGTKLVIVDDYLADIHMQAVFNDDVALNIAKLLQNHIWVIIRNVTPIPLYTSDNPVVFFPHDRNGKIANAGIASYGIVLFERTFHKDKERLEGKVINRNSEYIQYANQLQFIGSYRFLFSIDNNFSLARYCRKTMPNECIPNKIRYIKYGET